LAKLPPVGRTVAVALVQRTKTPFIESAADDGWSADGSISVGETLQARREELGLALDDVAEGLRIKPSYLAALERGRLEELPGQTYAIGFIRAYADYLGLGVDEVMSAFKAETSAFDARPDLSLPVPLAERSLPGGAMLLVALILALCGYGTWYYLSTAERSHPERVTEVPSPLRGAKPGPAVVEPPVIASAGTSGSAVGAAVASPAHDSVPPSPAGMPASGGTVIAAAPPPIISPAPIVGPMGSVSPAPSPASAPANLAPGVAAGRDAGRPAVANPQPPAPAEAGRPAMPGGSARIVIRATADCWVQVRDAEQSLVFSRVLRAGESYSVPQRAGLSMRTGNAGVLQIAVDGRNVPPIGTVGTLRRNVVLDPEALIAGTAVKG
jgi:cytoskeleton protein RodZ